MKNEKSIVAVVAAISSFLTPFMSTALNLALPSIGTEFSADTILLSWLVTSFLLASSALLLPFGRIADIIGRKRILLNGLLIFGLSSLMGIFSGSINHLILLRILQGIGSAMIFGTAIAILTSVYPLNERGKALGINIATVYIGLSLGPFLGGILTHYLGWRSIFLFSGITGIITYLIAKRFVLNEWCDAKGETFDYFGSITYIISLVFLVYGFITFTSGGSIFILASLLFGSIFIHREHKTENPILNIKLLTNNLAFSMSNLAALLNYGATYAVAFLISFYLQSLRGFSAQDAGLILLAQPLVQAIFSPITGKLSDKVEPRTLASLGMGITCIGLVLFSFIKLDTSIYQIILNLVLLGFGFALFSSPNTNAIMSSVERKFAGVASAMLATVRILGQMTSMAIITVLIAFYVGNNPISAEFSPLFLQGITASFKVSAILCLFGIFASLARKNIRNQN
ncbi:MFS transporter [Methanococcus maripaludis]|uniref:EmrB/QacA subfamily drug resistance transporter n=1 Tax=Methanococcus maripaludis TaxID=39152 RepID=A0A7J9S121_METMI|nr:MFS transporter [Methanococcus maripaludis]MBB6067390.1 EmrB/QacA subfamily drug resistance transporter [Methanococcus maripaludis]